MACPFCSIASNYPPNSDSAALANSELTIPSAFVVLSTPLCMAFLDIMPLSPGHLLLTTRKHNEKLSDVSAEESRELGEWLPRLSRALAKVTGVWDWNIVQNNGSFAPIFIKPSIAFAHKNHAPNTQKEQETKTTTG
ncbi:hypothetical protein ACMFMG_008912 [Clarireedia jacksonii]